jgi:hypothetical protein
MIWATGGFPFEIDDMSKFRMRGADLLPLYEATWAALSQANIAVYPLDVEDLVSPGYVSPSVGQPLPQHFHMEARISSLERFAEMTGGQTCYRTTDAQGCFQQAASDSADYYLLGFYADTRQTKPGWRKLAVKVNSAGAHVRSRTGYFEGQSTGTERNGKEELEFALTSPLEYTVLPVAVEWGSVTGVKGKKRVGFTFVIPPGAATLDEMNGNRISLDFAALAKDPAGVPSATFSKTLEGNLNADTAKGVKAQGVTFSGTMDLVPGEYSVSFAVRDNLNRQLGTVFAPLRVP